MEPIITLPFRWQCNNILVGTIICAIMPVIEWHTKIAQYYAVHVRHCISGHYTEGFAFAISNIIYVLSKKYK